MVSIRSQPADCQSIPKLVISVIYAQVDASWDAKGMYTMIKDTVTLYTMSMYNVFLFVILQLIIA